MTTERLERIINFVCAGLICFLGLNESVMVEKCFAPVSRGDFSSICASGAQEL